jgi:hypothetical protein
MRPDVSNVTQEEYESLFSKNGELNEQSADEESTETEEPEETLETQAEETEEEESTEEEAEEEEIDWNKVDERYRKQFEEARTQAEKWQKDYSKIQSKWTKESQSRKEELKALEDYRAKAEQLSQFEALLERNPKLANMLGQEIERINSPHQVEVPDYLKNDPMFQHIQQSVIPSLAALQNEIKQLKQTASKVTEWESKQVEARNREYLDNQLNAAKEQVKAIFGSEPTEEQVTAVLEYMVENKFYSNGKAAALAVFGDQFEKASRQRYEAEMKEKAKKFPSRNKTVNANRSATSRDAATAEEAIAMAMAEYHGQ